MRVTESIEIPAPPELVFPHVARLDAYPAWLRLVHDVELIDEDPSPTWHVELRARVGPFARSKRLTMERIELRKNQLAVFERAETDKRDHARWALRAQIEPRGANATTLTMHLAYDGGLWSGGVLEKVLDEEIRRGREGLVALLSLDPPMVVG